ncbi:hypothetical protein LIER_28537 [Lithospermum erythrorhizon]|uniref:RNase H type-1 domain-containing protein n=1 Tax=Lithospermum erythrorhizon TaxID=34254 RepID=A0AAV3RJE6_LITER
MEPPKSYKDVQKPTGRLAALSRIKAQVLADFIVESSTRSIPEAPDQDKKPEEVPKWILFVDGASNNKGAGAGILIKGVDEEQFEYALSFSFKATNNEAEYEAMVAGL